MLLIIIIIIIIIIINIIIIIIITIINIIILKKIFLRAFLNDITNLIFCTKVLTQIQNVDKLRAKSNHFIN